MLNPPVYPTDLTVSQKNIIRELLPELFVRPYKYDTFDILNAILYIVKTGCQWRMLPVNFPKWRCVYHHFRTWGEKGLFGRLMRCLTAKRRKDLGRAASPTVAVVDSQSVKWGLIQSEKGIDGNKKVKGIKRHIAVDSHGLPLGVNITRANVHDTRGVIPILLTLREDWQGIDRIKADLGYRNSVEKTLRAIRGPVMECVKSNYGSSTFVPIQGRWVVERTFSWLDIYRRVARNYEKTLRTSSIVTILALSSFLLRYFR